MVAHTVMKNSIAAFTLVVALAATALPAIGEEETMLEPGSAFPSFDLPAHDGTTVSSEDLKGSPYLLFFYPKADTGG